MTLLGRLRVFDKLCERDHLNYDREKISNSPDELILKVEMMKLSELIIILNNQDDNQTCFSFNAILSEIARYSGNIIYN